MVSLADLFEISAHNTESEITLIKENLQNFINSNISEIEKEIFLREVRTTLQRCEEYYFKDGFKTAINLILKNN